MCDLFCFGWQQICDEYLPGWIVKNFVVTNRPWWDTLDLECGCEEASIPSIHPLFLIYSHLIA
jgi:hypothetical protein